MAVEAINSKSNNFFGGSAVNGTASNNNNVSNGSNTSGASSMPGFRPPNDEGLIGLKREGIRFATQMLKIVNSVVGIASRALCAYLSSTQNQTPQQTPGNTGGTMQGNGTCNNPCVSDTPHTAPSPSPAPSPAPNPAPNPNPSPTPSPAPNPGGGINLLPFREKLRELFGTDPGKTLNEAELQYGIVSYQLYQKNPAIEAAYQKAFEMERAQGKSIPDAAKAALNSVREQKLIAKWEADWVYSLSYRAAQLDQSLDEVSNAARGRGRRDLETALSAAEMALVSIQNGGITVSPRSPELTV